MTQYIARRVLVAVPLILVITALVFVVLRVAVPGDPAELLAGDRASTEVIEQTRHNLGLDRPVSEQFVIFLLNALRGDLGRSIKTHEPVLEAIARAFPFTLLLTFLGVTVGTLVGIGVGIATAIYKNSWLDSACMATVVFLNSMPTFWLGLMLMLLLAVQLRWLPVQGTGSWKHLVMPVINLATGEAALIARLTRSSMIEVMNADYIRTANAKGLTQKVVIMQHALKNALIPVVTVVGISVGSLLGGAVITESIFGLPGVGRLAIESIHNRDYPMVQGTVLVVATAFIFVNLIVDIIYGYLDPRIHYS